MSLHALMALRTRFMAEVPVDEYLVGIYGKSARHFVGYKKSPSANDYPYFAYVPVRAKSKALVKTELVSVIIGVNDKEVVDDVFMGHSRLSDIIDLLEPVIKDGQLGDRAIVVDDYEVIGDFGERQPFYETELQLKLIWRQS